MSKEVLRQSPWFTWLEDLRHDMIIGVGVSIATDRLLQSELWGTTPTDPMTFAVGILVTLTIAAVACLVPARRAVRIEPMVALRQE